MTLVVVERTDLDDGVPLMYRAGPACIRVAYDPQQIAEPEALVHVALGLDTPLNGMQVEHAGPSS